MMWSEIDRRAKRDSPRQCLSDHGMHKDADAAPAPTGRVIYKARPNRRVFKARSLKDDLAALSVRRG